MKKQLSRLLCLISVFVCASSFPLSLLAQNLEVEQLTHHINGIAFRNNELWQAYSTTLVKRNLITGEVEATFKAPNIDGFQDIAIDPQGGIWLPLGKGGVARFDGNSQWEYWNTQNVPAFPSQMNFFNIAVEASTGRVWAYGRTQNFQRHYFTYDGNTWTEDFALRNFYWSRFVNGPQGQFVFSADDTLLVRQNNNWVAIPKPGGNKYTPLNNPTFDAQGQLWVTGAKHLYRYKNLGTLPDTMTILSTAVQDMEFDDNGALYLATKNQGLNLWNGDSLAFIPSLAGSPQKTYVAEVEKDPFGRLWLIQCIESYYEKRALALTLWNNGAPQKNFYYGIPQAGKMSRDGAGNMWFGGYEPLLIRKNGSNGSLDYFEMLNIPNFLSYYTKMKPGIGKELWLQTTYNKLLHFNGVAWTPFAIPNPADYITGFCTDSKGRFYISDPNSIQYRDLGSSKWITIDLSALNNWPTSVGELTVDKNDNLWFGSTRWLGCFSNGSVKIYDLPETSVEESEVQTGPAGMVYVVTNGKAVSGGITHLFQFNSLNKEWKTIAWPDPLTTDWIQRSPFSFRWHVDLQGRVWMTVNTNHDGSDLRYWYWGNDVWTETFGLPEHDNEEITSDSKGNVYFGSDIILAQLKSAGLVEGILRHDIDSNCQPTSADTPLPNFIIAASDGADQYIDLSQSDGSYRIHSGSEQVTVRVVPPNLLWSACIPNGVPLTLQPGQPSQLNLLAQIAFHCPQMKVDVSTPFLRRCSNNTYTAKVCNTGTALATAAYVDITLPEEMDMQSSGNPYSLVAPQQYRFPIGDLAVGACSTFQFVVKVNCNKTTLGQALCVLAHVYPDTLATQMSAGWKGATVLLETRCESDSVRFSLKNTGNFATSQPVQYQVLRNEGLFSTGSFHLQPGQQHQIATPADGATWRLEATQEPAHPFLPIVPSLAVEACGATLGNFEKGYVTNRPNSSGSGFEDLDCQMLIGSFDPNDKTASPVGVGENTHFVLPGTPLEYHIRFQNTGTDTAFTVVVRDTLHPLLDLTTFEPGASSHPYHLDIRGNALTFVFENILLPDSNINLGASQGFLQYRIQPRHNIPLGSLVTNSAAIYFDFNPAVVTNTVWHIVDDVFLHNVSSVGGPQQDGSQQPGLWVFPNPASGNFQVKTPAENGTLELYNAQGQLQQTLRTQGASAPIQIECGDLPEGLYLLRFTGKDQRMIAGKIVLRRN